MSSKPTQSQSNQKTGGMFSQFLEFFGMTPSVPSEYLTRIEKNDEGQRIVWRCQACHNPTRWEEKEERWRCPSHPQAKVFESQ